MQGSALPTISFSASFLTFISKLYLVPTCVALCASLCATFCFLGASSSSRRARHGPPIVYKAVVYNREAGFWLLNSALPRLQRTRPGLNLTVFRPPIDKMLSFAAIALACLSAARRRASAYPTPHGSDAVAKERPCRTLSPRSNVEARFSIVSSTL